MTIRVLLVFALGLALPLLASQAQQPPNASGTWVLNAAKSDFGQMPGPPDLTFKIKESGVILEVRQEVGGEVTDMKFRTDGQETVNQLPSGEMRSKYRIENGVTLGEHRVSTPNGEVTLSDRITYSEDGKIMTLERKIKFEGGEAAQKFVLDKK